MAQKKTERTVEERLALLFQGNARSSGRFNPANERVHTEPVGLTLDNWKTHLEGKEGVGAIPILDDNTCKWAALDIDNHDSDEDIPLVPLEKKIRELKLPLILCRSKSGGAHAYLFLAKPHPAARVRALMSRYSEMLGYGKCEIFPKQGHLFVDKAGKRQLGNWINLPYMGNGKTNRYAVYGGKKLSLEAFIDLAEGSAATEEDMRSASGAEHPEAPPCIQRIYAEGVKQGYRNEALYNVVVYLRKSHPDDYEHRGHEANQSLFDKPLPKGEAARTVNSAGRPDYKYRCHEEPIRSLCDKETCFKRKFGISKGEYESLASTESLPVFSDLVKYLSDPVRWELKIDGIKVTNLSTEAIMDFRVMRLLIAERLTRVVPNIKLQEWERVLQPLMREVRLIEAPDDASIAGVIRDRLREFAAKCNLMSKGEDNDDRKALLRGLPVVTVLDGARCVAWRGQDFVNFLKRTKTEELKGVNLWFAVKDMGVGVTRFRIPGGSHNIHVWFMPVREVLRDIAEVPKMKSEL
jgi:hypothetical protein